MFRPPTEDVFWQDSHTADSFLVQVSGSRKSYMMWASRFASIRAARCRLFVFAGVHEKLDAERLRALFVKDDEGILDGASDYTMFR